MLAGHFSPVAVHLPEASMRCQQFFIRAFASKPTGRPASARMLYTELERALVWQTQAVFQKQVFLGSPNFGLDEWRGRRDSNPRPLP